MPCYWVLKRRYSERAGLVRGYQPWVWDPLPTPFKSMTSIPASRVGFKGLVKRILTRHGIGTYLILREQFAGEKPEMKPVVMFEVRQDGRYRLLKRYTQFKSHSDETQAYWKEHERRLHITLDVRERLRERHRALLERIKYQAPKLSRPKPYKIEGRTWKYERR